jgi:GDP-L-fucose synthase
MKILLTGSTGMVGQNILENEQSKNYKFIIPNRAELDLTNFDETKNYLLKNNPDFIVNAAGRVGGIHANMTNQTAFMLENFDINRNLIIASRECGIERLLNLGSSCMYPKDAINPLKEEFLFTGSLEPTNEGYAISKCFAAKLCQFINLESDSLKYKTIVPCNLYGKFDSFDPINSHMLPAAIRKVHEAIHTNQDIVNVWGSGRARREFMYVEDFSNFLFYAINNFEKMPSIMNVGIGKDYSISEYYQNICDTLGFKGELVFDKSKPEGMQQKLVDISLLKNFGWESSFSLKEGIIRTHKYFRKL